MSVTYELKDEKLIVKGNETNPLLDKKELESKITKKVKRVEFQGKIKFPSNCHSMFAYKDKLEEIIFGNEVDTSDMEIMSSMFEGCDKLKTLDLSCFNTSKVYDMQSVFRNCDNLIELNIKSFDTSNVESMNGMFMDCKNLTELDLKHFKTEKLNNMEMMFDGCKNLTTLDLSSFDIKKLFNGCDKLDKIIF